MEKKMKKPTVLTILDGWGYRKEEKGNAVLAANTPELDKLLKNYPHTLINCSGLAVGLPEGQMGNSEVGHLNIGAGRLVYQSLTRISKSIEDGDFFKNKVLLEAMQNVHNKNSALHIMGLLSDGGVHSHIDHVEALIEMAKRNNVDKVFIHAFLDGRDTPPTSAGSYLEKLETIIDEKKEGQIVSIVGRYYAMDRDNRWDRVELAYDELTLGAEYKYSSSKEAIEAAYIRGENDEFVLPTSIVRSNEQLVTMKDGDSIIFFDFRPDRAREITRAFTEKDFDGFERKVVLNDLYYVTMTEYDATFNNVHIAFEQEELNNTLGEYVSSLGLKQLRLAETEKYAHVTFFFNGGVEKPNANEDRILIPSPKVATYDLKPEMSAFEVADIAVEKIESGEYDLIIINFANMDMVGHTGVFDAAVKAVEAVDKCVGMIVKALEKVDGQMIVTADHGNCEEMIADDGSTLTAHTTDKVKLIVFSNISENIVLRQDGSLPDIAPTLLHMMGVKKPAEMTGNSLI